MKRWAKVLLVVGIVLLALAVIYVWYLCSFMTQVGIGCVGLEGCPSEIGCGLWDWIVGVLVFGIPSWIMFVVVSIWGRDK